MQNHLHNQMSGHCWLESGHNGFPVIHVLEWPLLGQVCWNVWWTLCKPYGTHPSPATFRVRCIARSSAEYKKKIKIKWLRENDAGNDESFGRYVLVHFRPNADRWCCCRTKRRRTLRVTKASAKIRFWFHCRTETRSEERCRPHIRQSSTRQSTPSTWATEEMHPCRSPWSPYKCRKPGKYDRRQC